MEEREPTLFLHLQQLKTKNKTKVYEAVFLDVGQKQGWTVAPTIAFAYCLQRISRQQCRDGKPRAPAVFLSWDVWELQDVNLARILRVESREEKLSQKGSSESTGVPPESSAELWSANAHEEMTQGWRSRQNNAQSSHEAENCSYSQKPEWRNLIYVGAWVILRTASSH